MAAAMDTDIFGDDADDDLGDEIARADPDEIVQRTRMLENEIKVLRNETARLRHEQEAQKEKIKENTEKIKLNKQLPFLVANVVELLDLPEDETEEDGANVDLDATRKGKSFVLKTSTRQTIFLPIPGLVEPAIEQAGFRRRAAPFAQAQDFEPDNLIIQGERQCVALTNQRRSLGNAACCPGGLDTNLPLRHDTGGQGAGLEQAGVP